MFVLLSTPRTAVLKSFRRLCEFSDDRSALDETLSHHEDHEGHEVGEFDTRRRHFFAFFAITLLLSSCSSCPSWSNLLFWLQLRRASSNWPSQGRRSWRLSPPSVGCSFVSFRSEFLSVGNVADRRL